MAGKRKIVEPCDESSQSTRALGIQYISGIQYMYFMRKFGYKVFTHK